MRPADLRQRRRALDMGGSFIVQAPAGSGKTELLTQRFLKVLARVEQPEQVLAITFTRKATQEMRERILRRLEQAATGVVPDPPHERLAVELADQVLARDSEFGWRVRRNPQRLQIHTIDGLCARIAGRSPLVGHGAAGLGMVESAMPLYREAARRLIEDAGRPGAFDEIHRALVTALTHVEGRTQALLDLLAGMLGRRDQWLKRLGTGRAELLEVLAWQQAVELEYLEAALGEGAVTAVLQALDSMADGAEDREAARKLTEAIERSALQPGDPGSRAGALATAFRLIASTAREPFKPGSINSRVLRGEGPGRDAHVEVLKEVVGRWHEEPAAVHAFRRFLKTPPLEGQPGADALLAALKILLVAAAAELSVLFHEQARADFPFVADLALQALGDEDAPGDALLAEDLRLAHILMDEFQDTSHTQVALLRRLVSGWEPGDGRTLFLVGDPMQSIYRFREADVKLFRRVFDRQRLGDVPVEPLQLTSNFRSRSELIDWVNVEFGRVFETSAGPGYGAIPYTPVAAERPAGGQVAVQAWHEGHGETEEARRIADLVADRLAARPGVSVAVLARARKHLESIAATLLQRGIPFEAVKVDPLGQRPVVLDLLAFTRALLHPADRIAWLALLRAPWCGLTTAQLRQAAGPDRATDILARLSSGEASNGLAGEAASRVGRLGEVLAGTMALRGRWPLQRLVEIAWLACGGAYAAGSAAELDNAQQFFGLLADLEAEQPEDLLERLQERLLELYSAASSAPVQLMTIHQAKGLEFDVVVLPGLHRIPRGRDRTLVRHIDLPVAEDSGVLMAPLKHRGSSDTSLYDYLGTLDAEEEACEAQRALYVAATRAREELHLFGAWKFSGQGTRRRPACDKRSFMHLLWPCFEAVIDPDAAADQAAAEDQEAPELPLLRLRGEPVIAKTAAPPAESGEPVEMRLPDRSGVALGDALHLWLELIHDHWEAAETGDRLTLKWLAAHPEALDSSLLRSGAEPGQVATLRERLLRMLRTVLESDTGRATVSPAGKPGSWAELVLYEREGVALRRHVLDRLYDDGEGRPVIVDYKTGRPDAAARQKWEAQLRRYRACLAQLVDQTAEAHVLHIDDSGSGPSFHELQGED